VFGVGADAVPLVKLAKAVGFFVTVVDCRSSYLFPGRFALADRCLSLPVEKLAGHRWDTGSAVVVMTHNYPLDREILRSISGESFAYLGVLGPKKRAGQLLDALRDDGVTFSPEQALKFFAPVGLDIGAENPEEIALAILAEVQATLTGRRGGFLRDRNSPIHPRADL
jgi:xanthine/CO dehydrogenase XdhC/CoxF family maturation factor